MGRHHHDQHGGSLQDQHRSSQKVASSKNSPVKELFSPPHRKISEARSSSSYHPGHARSSRGSQSARSLGTKNIEAHSSPNSPSQSHFSDWGVTGSRSQRRPKSAERSHTRRSTATMTPRSTRTVDRPQSEVLSTCRLQRCSYSPPSEVSYTGSRCSTQSTPDARELLNKHLEVHAARSPDVAERTAYVHKAINKRRDFADAQKLLLQAAADERKRRDHEKTADPIQERHKKDFAEKFLSNKQLMRAEEEIGKKYASKYKNTFEAFSWLKTDNQRRLDRNEIINFFNDAGFPKSFAVQHFERILDKNATGKIDLGDFKEHFCRRMVNGVYKPSTPTKKPEIIKDGNDALQKLVEDLGHNTYRRFNTVQAAFRAVDTEKDGSLSRDDLKKYFINRGFDKSYSNRVFDAMSSDGSGRVTFDEFKNLFGKFILQVEDD